MPDIQILDSHIADLIAAGEVVERPASVVKELMENAIDAGATSIAVEIAHGGMSYIRVTDNGCGIPSGQLPTAFLRHATSKLRSAYDLEAIGSLGFRGEALAAICAVARVEVISRTADQDFGSALTLEGGIVTSQEEAGGPVGTTMIVRDLFFNTPARLKFMKKDTAEGAAVFATVQRQAMAHPEIAVSFLRDGKQELSTPGDGQLKSAVYAVLGRDLALGLLDCKGSGEDGTQVSGMISLPACCRGSRNYQFFFVNGRFVKSRLLMAALEQAYANSRMIGKFPACVLHLTTRFNGVDVNVHPAKTEVKFVSDKKMFDSLYQAVLGTLEGNTSHPAVTVKPAVKVVQDTVTQNQIQLTIEKPATQPAPATPQVVAQPIPEQVPPVAKEDAPPAPVKPMVNQIIGGSLRLNDVAQPKLMRPSVPQPEPEPIPEPEPLLEEKPAPEPEPEPVVEVIPWQVKGELFHTYIMVEQGETAFLIDKHAAHERLNFDRLQAQDYQPMVQQLLTPVAFTPNPEEGGVLLEHLELLEHFGFEVEDFGGGAVIVRQAPDYVDAGDIEGALVDVATGLLSHKGTNDLQDSRDHLLATMACKAAIKGGQKNDPLELQRVAELVMSGQVKYCPHGRPVAVELSKKQLEKMFRRA